MKFLLLLIFFVALGTPNARAQAPSDHEVVHGSFTDAALDAGASDEVGLQGSDREVDPGVVYFQSLPVRLTINYQDLVYAPASKSLVVNLRCALKGYQFQRCALVLNADLYIMLGNDQIHELNDKISYNLAYSRSISVTGTSWSNTANIYYHNLNGWVIADAFPNAAYPSTSRRGVRVKGIGQWTFSKQLISDIIAAFDPKIKDSAKESADLVYSADLSRDENVCVRYKPNGDCDLMTNVYKRTVNSELKVQKDRSDGMPFSFDFRVQLDGDTPSTQLLDLAQTLTETQILD